jgi:hypothetical protein
MFMRTVFAGIGGIVVLFGLARPATAQGCGASYPQASESGAYYPALSPAYSQREVGGLIYYYDRTGYPLYYDDYVHSNYPRRFLYRNGGWVLLSGYHGSGYGVRQAGGYRAHRGYPGAYRYSGAPYGGYSTRHYGDVSTHYSGGYSTGHRGSYAGGHAGSRGGGHYGGGHGHR